MVVCTGLEIRLGVLTVNKTMYSVTRKDLFKRKDCNPVCPDMESQKQEDQEAGSLLLQQGRGS